MSGARRGGFLGCGDRVRFHGDYFTVLRVSGTLVVLGDDSMRTPDRAVRLSELQSDPDFTVLGVASSARVPAASQLEGLPKDVMVQARWWERHVLEVIRGGTADDPAQADPKPQYDLALTTMVARERAKADELTASGFLTSARTVRRQRQRYEAHGLAGLVDGRRRTQHPPAASRADQKVIAALRTAIDETVDASTRTVSYLIWRAGQLLVQEHGDQAPPMPARSTCYRLVAQLSDKHTTGSARTRRSLASQPDKPFSHLPVDAPGEVVQIDTTPLDVLVLLPNGVVGRVELTGMIDVATRTVTAAVLTPTTKAVDASVLLARSVTPEPMRPGWVDALRMAYSVLPHRRLLAIDERLEHAAARPVIIPDTIVCDQGKVFISNNFRSSCRFLGISFQPTHPASGANKPHVERLFSSVGTLFAQFVSGFVGRSTEHRGFRIDQQPLWTMLELQALLDEWLIAGWQNRPHDGLRDPLTPGRAFTPNEKYAALVEAAGYVPVAMTADDYIELLPATWRRVSAGGLKINNRTYDSAVLNPIRRQPSGINSRRDLWEVHYDPYDVAYVWVRDHRTPGTNRWLQATWKHLARAPIPFGELAWNHVRAGLGPNPDETAVADAVQRLLAKANNGPPQPNLSARDRRVAARTAATSESRPVPRQQPPAPEPDTAEPPPAGKVIPLRVFDPAEEARRPW